MLLNVCGREIKNWFMFIFWLKLSLFSWEGKEAYDNIKQCYFQFFQL